MKKRVLVTSALPYINGVKHLGNLIGSLLPADVYTRYMRLKGEEVLFICGTDEHGTPAELGAANESKQVDVYCEENYSLQKEIYRRFNIGFDHFGRTSSEFNQQTTQGIFSKLDEGGFIAEREMNQIFSIDDNRFLADRYVVGTCPKCGYKSARGDQCDGCGELLDPTDLIEPRSAISGSSNIEVRKTKHLFLRLDALEPKINSWIESHSNWSANVLGIARKWISEGLKERCITRDLEWGVRVNKPGYEKKVFYVWFDAPIAYISLTKEWASKSGDHQLWEKWWKDPENVRLVQFMAKDNVAFHTVFWPGVMLATKEDWVFADEIKGFNWLTYDGGKFSTSAGRGVFMDTALELYPSDYWRYSLLASAPESDDANFSFEQFALHVNKDLADVLGNFSARVSALVKNKFEGVLPAGFEIDSTLLHEISSKATDFRAAMDQLKFRFATQILRSMWAVGNEYISVQAPWSAIKTDRARAANILKNCLFLQNIFSIYSSSHIPEIADKLAINSYKKNALDECLKYDWLDGEFIIQNSPLFIDKIDSVAVKDLTNKYSGAEKFLPPPPNLPSSEGREKVGGGDIQGVVA